MFLVRFHLFRPTHQNREKHIHIRYKSTDSFENRQTNIHAYTAFHLYLFTVSFPPLSLSLAILPLPDCHGSHSFHITIIIIHYTFIYIIYNSYSPRFVFGAFVIGSFAFHIQFIHVFYFLASTSETIWLHWHALFFYIFTKLERAIVDAPKETNNDRTRTEI